VSGLFVLALSAGEICGQTDGAVAGPFDGCGVLVAGNGCVLFEVGGAQYVIPDAGRFEFGDAVRVVGTLDPECITICEVDGCIRGGVVYDPAVYPCGTRLPDFPGDLFRGLCDAVSAGLVGATATGLLFTRRR
jgi:hypothetical protein